MQSQKGVAPRMFKSLVGRGHPEFSTNRQQDAQEYLLHIFNIIEVSFWDAQIWITHENIFNGEPEGH